MHVGYCSPAVDTIVSSVQPLVLGGLSPHSACLSTQGESHSTVTRGEALYCYAVRPVLRKLLLTQVLRGHGGWQSPRHSAENNHASCVHVLTGT